jgi:LysR family transcriptional regulator, low CO2-responsive transcriptional regulator
MDIRQLKAFVAIAESGTFTAGAARVHVTQAAISMQIRQLETETRAQLFIRAPRRVILTEAGEKLIERAYTILREHDAALEELAALTGAHRGRLRIGSASAMVSADPLPQILREVRGTHAGVETSVVSGTSESLVKQVLAGELDAVFVSLPVEARGVHTELLSEDYLVAIASPRHALAKQKVVSAYALAGEKLILGESGGNTRRLIDQFFAQAGVTLQVTMELSRLSAIKRMVEEDMGVGIVPLRSVQEEVAKGTLVRWWIEGAQINWQLGVARLIGGYESPIHLKFLELCREHFAPLAEGSSPSSQKQKKKKKVAA